jgi:hypothetical protein
MIAPPDRPDDVIARGARPETWATPSLPDTPHELPLDRAVVDSLVDRVRSGERLNLLEATLDAIDWSIFATADGASLTDDAQRDLRAYCRQKWSDVGPLFLAELLSTEFITEQRARGDIVFSDQLLRLGREEPELWREIRQVFRRKEMVTALLAAAHDPAIVPRDESDELDEEDLWE